MSYPTCQRGFLVRNILISYLGLEIFSQIKLGYGQWVQLQSDRKYLKHSHNSETFKFILEKHFMLYYTLLSFICCICLPVGCS